MAGHARVRMFGVVGVHDAGTTRPSMYVADGGACDWQVVSVGVWRAVKPVDWTGLDYLDWCDETTCDEDTTVVASIGDTVSIARTSMGRDSEAVGH